MRKGLLNLLSKAYPKGQQRNDFIEITESDLINAASLGVEVKSIVRGAVVQSLKSAATKRWLQVFVLYFVGILYLISIIERPGFHWISLVLLILLGFKAAVGSLYLNLKASSKSSILLLISSFSALALQLILSMGEAISCSDCTDPYLGSSSALLPFDFGSAVFVSLLTFGTLVSFAWTLQSLIVSGLWRQMILILLAFGIELILLFLLLGISKYLNVLGIGWQAMIVISLDQALGLFLLIAWIAAALSSTVIMLAALVRAARARKTPLA
jgi:hypothetical protein